jgi:hypothetical protein
MDILKKIKEYNNKKTIEFNKKLNIKKKYNLNFDKTKKDIITMSEDSKKILVGKFIFFGIYQPINQLWVWSSSIPGVNQKHIKLIREIRNKSYIFENEDNDDIMFIYQFLTNDVIYVDNENQLTLISNVLNYLSDGFHMLTPINKASNQQFLCITKILEEYI